MASLLSAISSQNPTKIGPTPIAKVKVRKMLLQPIPGKIVLEGMIKHSFLVFVNFKVTSNVLSLHWYTEQPTKYLNICSNFPL